MTRKERNNKLKYLITCMKCEVSGKCCDDNCPTQYNAGNMGEIIENLEEISKLLEQEPCENAINREAVLKLQYRIDDSATISTRDVVNVEDIEDLPSVTPKEKTGHWITEIKSDLRGDMWPTNPKCSECGEEPYYSNTIYNYNFCPYCGARMVEPRAESKDKK